jgi:hypothetical protein
MACSSCRLDGQTTKGSGFISACNLRCGFHFLLTSLGLNTDTRCDHNTDRSFGPATESAVKGQNAIC